MQNPAWTDTVHHDGSPLYVQGDYKMGSSQKIWLRVGADAPVERVFLRSYPNGEQAVTPMEAVPVGAGADGKVRWWEGTLPLTMPQNPYRFMLLTDEGGWWYSAAGATRHSPTDATDFKLLAGYNGPEWVRSTVFYQIFPDRFADGDSSNNVKNGEYSVYGQPVIARKWGERPNTARGYGGREFFGGDLQGITQNLDYLQDLGVTAVYLTPIFTAPTNHKYDVADYREVDPHFGGNAALADLRSALDGRGMRLMLDIVPNHSGKSHGWFTAALADPQSPTAEYFFFYNHPGEYESWFGTGTLPKLNYQSLALRDEMYAGENSIMRSWMRPPYRIDGWRVDVANMLGRQGESQLGHKVGRGMRKAVKAEDPQTYLLGEHFHDGTSHLQGDELDASMNYRGFSLPLLRWLSGFDTAFPARPYANPHPLPSAALADQWQVFLAAIPWQIALQQFNLLGSHDTPRVLTAVKNDVGLAKVAAAVLMTFPGVPCVYYGDEIGMEGGSDPDNRRPMVWEADQWNGELREFYQKLIRWRKELEVLQQGGFQMLYAEDNTIAYQRERPGERLIVVARRGADGLAALPLTGAGLGPEARFRELLSGKEATLSDERLSLDGLPDTGVQIWYSGK